MELPIVNSQAGVALSIPGNGFYTLFTSEPNVTFANPFDGCGMYLHGAVYCTQLAVLKLGPGDLWEYSPFMRATADLSNDQVLRGWTQRVHDGRATTVGGNPGIGDAPEEAHVSQVVMPFTVLERPGGFVTFGASEDVNAVRVNAIPPNPVPTAVAGVFHVSFTAWPISDPGAKDPPGPPV